MSQQHCPSSTICSASLHPVCQRPFRREYDGNRVQRPIRSGSLAMDCVLHIQPSATPNTSIRLFAERRRRSRPMRAPSPERPMPRRLAASPVRHPDRTTTCWHTPVSARRTIGVRQPDDERFASFKRQRICFEVELLIGSFWHASVRSAFCAPE